MQKCEREEEEEEVLCGIEGVKGRQKCEGEKKRLLCKSEGE